MKVAVRRHAQIERRRAELFGKQPRDARERAAEKRGLHLFADVMEIWGDNLERVGLRLLALLLLVIGWAFVLETLAALILQAGQHLTGALPIQVDISFVISAMLLLVLLVPSSIAYQQYYARLPASGALLADAHWGTANLAVVDWRLVGISGDEFQARRRRDSAGKVKDWAERLADYQSAVRAYRQLVVELQARGLNEEADSFAYRGQLMRRAVLLRQFKPLRWLGSFLLDIVSGYGYRPLRSFVTYAFVVAGFAVAYFILGGAHGQPLSWNEAIVVSMTAFHGRGFFAAVFQPGDLQAAVAAVEAFFGLLIEITFIATFTQRFFAR